ncbi:molybdenum cofactor guanylyltransferase [Sedimentibacter hydroxybenzoicus DSM 7310]|uniref:Probable molybdenum cofactor guanylyltransferase n=1 Tax=Sedimentibacter hydroxybenzoicus DSM 7310 TaxID=1123245 RepID=A0A974BK86_SEDHY|nr:molybdenum cofactor guanylyltransferase [Sedimentibacter hydroxybenzoicus]NYB74563.1 molybdenum cofactor guanylyltransferase [Sedimentibacter hydroxybenzoicus DSM 7310]
MKKFGTAIILAGGKSSRMGFDKQLLKINERSLMDRMIQKLSREFEEIIIVTNKPELYIGLSHKITKDILKDMGALGGIHAGLSHSSSSLAFVAACDMPNINMEYVRYLKDRLNDNNSLGCVTKFGDWIEPFCSFYSVELIKNIGKYLESGRRSVHGLIKDVNISYIEEKDARKFSPNWDMFLNLNTREDLNKFLLNAGGWSN